MDIAHNFTCLTPLTFLDYADRAFPKEIAITTNTRSISFAELRCYASSLKNVLISCGAKTKDRVGILSCNGFTPIISHFSIPATGAILVNFNPKIDGELLAKQISHARVKILVVGENIEEETCQYLSMQCDICILMVNKTEIVNFKTADTYHLDSLHDDLLLESIVENELDPICVNYTSGSTGEPKGVVFSHRAAYLHSIGQVLMYGMQRHKNYAWTLPMFHVNGWGHMWSMVSMGARQFILESWELESSWALSEFFHRYKINYCAGAPRLATKVVGAVKQNTHGLKMMIGGASPSSKLIEMALESGVELIHQYGLSETCGPFTMSHQNIFNQSDVSSMDVSHIERQGTPTLHAGMGMTVLDKSGKGVKWDGKDIGEIVLRGNTVFTEYLDAPEKTSSVIAKGWFKTGDLAVVHDDGQIQIKDRAKDIVHRLTSYGWENVSTIEIENELNRLDQVKDAAVIGIEDEQGTILVAVIELKEGQKLKEDTIKQKLGRNIPEYMIPDRILYEKFEKTATGKINKQKLKIYVTKMLAEKLEPEEEADCL